MMWGIGFVPSYTQAGWHKGKKNISDIHPFLCDLSKPVVIIGGLEYFKDEEGFHHLASPFNDVSPPDDTYDTLDARSTVYKNRADAINRINKIMKEWFNFKSKYQYYDFDPGM